ncbi:unnamed protein product [Symbiodinium sp. CCMP2592]|nr:unnamed protein product [Symbiodinium sp. CCMP2592]CAE7332527.1 unnamed protein product [Symbiodinium sp. CCMP2592]CAE7339930.1 unnamed protein product [Symbiodinium sp. CCMP2592]CAE7526955.1 unnamed protein product [Symbiodinium sp. CCMP2592]
MKVSKVMKKPSQAMYSTAASAKADKDKNNKEKKNDDDKKNFDDKNKDDDKAIVAKLEEQVASLQQRMSNAESSVKLLHGVTFSMARRISRGLPMSESSDNDEKNVIVGKDEDNDVHDHAEPSSIWNVLEKGQIF